MFVLTIPAWVAHEVTHYAAALAVGARPVFQVFPGPAVEYDAAAPRIVDVAPTVLGSALGAVAVLRYGVPPLTPLTTVALAYWVVFTYPSPEDRQRFTAGATGRPDGRHA